MHSLLSIPNEPSQAEATARLKPLTQLPRLSATHKYEYSDKDELSRSYSDEEEEDLMRAVVESIETSSREAQRKPEEEDLNAGMESLDLAKEDVEKTN